MNNITSIIMLIAVAVLCVFAVRLYGKFFPSGKKNWTKLIARTAIFGAISTILYVVPIFQVKLPFLPSFLSLHFDEIPIFVAGFAYGPLTATVIILVKTLIKLPMTSTLAVGEFADFVFSVAFIVPATLVYKHKRNLKGVAIGLGISTLLQIVIATVLNIYVMLPFYMSVMGLPEAAIKGMCMAANPAIINSLPDWKWGYGLLAVVPLNVIKDSIVIVVTFIVYRSIHKLLRFEK
ncbi:MAG: ECF transporter S component [Bacilli bacterium]|nr:ECF transporter S component [Bacilli bacterium]